MCVLCAFAGAPCAVRVLCEKSAAMGHGSQGPEFYTPPQCCFEWIMHASVGGWFAGMFLGISNVMIGAVHALCETAPFGVSRSSQSC